ncbi:OB-fold nucleic acid binding domain-containing protein [Halomarina halobia]|uniref:OB-fold nucleic acid binding domain-containing protein n=1 Tax=Halomarina halobia TaxID=3033386 RepID=A0ABD6A4F1_9EURY|nr:OB-fold nucleic acid binding domain-containing protein [Halomarina sp. PSR21]
MGTCIICGTSTDGRICESHEEDVVFEFRGNHPNQLTPGRFYRGEVDGYADFGVFVNLSDNVTGLLHRSELNRRLESLTWEVGDPVYVQVKNVRDNGNVDLGWSIRQADREFRGALVDDPSASPSTYLPDEAGEEDEEPSTPRVRTPEADSASRSEPEPASDAGADVDAASASDAGSQPDAATGTDETETDVSSADAEPAVASADAAVVAERPRAAVAELDERVGDTVRLEGRVAGIRQTSGPTVFELQDESGTVDCAAFEEAGVRAYPAVDLGDLVRLDGEVRRRRGELQIETEALAVLDEEDADAVTDRMAAALDERARPADVEPLASDPAVEAALDDVREAATAIRRAIIAGRPVVVRHDANVDGYLAGAALERAILPLVRDEYTNADAAYHYFDRRPLEDGVYDMDDATKDTTMMLSNRDRHDEKIPLVVFAAAGSTRDSLDGFELLSIYDAERVVVDGAPADEEVADAVDVLVNPARASADASTTATALAVAVAQHVNEAVADDLRHLPAASFWEDTPDAYLDLAGDAGYGAADVERLREAIALEAYYQSYEDKRELVIDLLFADESGSTGPSKRLVEQVSEQFREKLDAEVATAEANLERRAEGGVAFAVLDVDAYTHRFDFPSTDVLLDAVHRRNRDGSFVTIGVNTDELHVRSTFDLDVRAVAETAAETVGNAGVAARGGRNRIEFVAGERERVVDAVIDAIAEQA